MSLVLMILAVILIPIVTYMWVREARGKKLSEGEATFTVLSALYVAVCVILNIWTVVSTGHVGVQYVAGKVFDAPLTEGWHLVNPFTDIDEMSIGGQTCNTPDGGAYVLTSEGVQVNVKVEFTYNLDSAAAPQVYRFFGSEYPSRVIYPAINSALLSAGKAFDPYELYSQKQDEYGYAVSRLTREKIDSILAPYPTLDHTAFFVTPAIKQITLPGKIKDAIDAQYAANEMIQTKQFEVDAARLEAERLKIMGEARRVYNASAGKGLTKDLVDLDRNDAIRAFKDNPNTMVVLSNDAIPVAIGNKAP